MRFFSIFSLLFLFALCLKAQNRPTQVVVEDIPTSLTGFFALRDRLASTPEGGAATFIVASIIYSRDPHLGRQCLIIASDADLLRPSSRGGYEGFDFATTSDYLVKQLDSKTYVPLSYVVGTSPARAYELGRGPYEFLFPRRVSQGQSGGRDVVQLYVRSSGADSDRPISVRRNDKGHWKAINFSSLVVGVRPPQKPSAGPAGGDF